MLNSFLFFFYFYINQFLLPFLFIVCQMIPLDRCDNKELSQVEVPKVLFSVKPMMQWWSNFRFGVPWEKRKKKKNSSFLITQVTHWHPQNLFSITSSIQWCEEYRCLKTNQFIHWLVELGQVNSKVNFHKVFSSFARRYVEICVELLPVSNAEGKCSSWRASNKEGSSFQ